MGPSRLAPRPPQGDRLAHREARRLGEDELVPYFKAVEDAATDTLSARERKVVLDFLHTLTTSVTPTAPSDG